eukprot:3335-Heterococcus_DN1.PRE.8
MCLCIIGKGLHRLRSQCRSPNGLLATFQISSLFATAIGRMFKVQAQLCYRARPKKVEMELSAGTTSCLCSLPGQNCGCFQLRAVASLAVRQISQRQSNAPIFREGVQPEGRL